MSAWLPQMHQLMAAFGVEIARSPLNLSFVFALLCCVLFWLFVWQTRYGYALASSARTRPRRSTAASRPARSCWR